MGSIPAKPFSQVANTDLVYIAGPHNVCGSYGHVNFWDKLLIRVSESSAPNILIYYYIMSIIMHELEPRLQDAIT